MCVVKDFKFKREGFNILYMVNIFLIMVLLGGMVEILIFEGVVNVKVLIGINIGDKIIFIGMGMK